MSAPWPAGPAEPAEPAGEVHVWRAELDAAGLAKAESLPPEERRRAERMRRPGAGRSWTASRWALRTVLSRYLDEDAATLALESGPHGKPALVDAPSRLDFNLSHSGSLALVAVTIGVEVGVDVERADPGRDFLALAEHGLDPDTAAALRASEPGGRAARFYAAWVRREALLKCRGGGLGNPAPAEPVTVRDLEIDPGYAAALAVASVKAPPLRCFSLGPD